MMKIFYFAFYISVICLTACSKDESNITPEQQDNNHVFKDQVQAVEKAKEVEDLLQNSANKKRRAIEEQSN